jgi:hypothetical protein
MSDHDPNGDDDFLRYGRRDDSNMGHESVPARHKTVAYSFVDGKEVPMTSRPAREMPAVQATPIVSVNAALAPTEEMVAVPLPTKPLDVKAVVSNLIEKDIEAWKRLPTSVRDLMLKTPEKFSFYEFTGTGEDLTPDIIYGGVRFRYENNMWRLYSIEVK